MATKDTGGGQQKATRSTEEVEEQAQDAQAAEDLKERHEKLSDDVDSVLDEIDDVLNLAMWLDVSGVRRQTGSTSTMIFDPYFIVHYLSQFLVLEPGDLINTGTPPGVGMGLRPPAWLKPGDVMELSIDGLGRQRQQVLGPR